MAAVTTPARGSLPRASGPRFADPFLQGVLAVIAASVLVIIGFFFLKLIIESEPALEHTGVMNFVFSNNWVPSRGQYGAFPLVFGTLLTSGLSLLIGVPIAVASALYITELAPCRVLGQLDLLDEFL